MFLLNKTKLCLVIAHNLFKRSIAWLKLFKQEIFEPSKVSFYHTSNNHQWRMRKLHKREEVDKEEKASRLALVRVDNLNILET